MGAHPLIVNATTTDFDVVVLERSRRTPVLVDFWAPWCGPCRMLTPVLETVTMRHAGAFVLAKVDTQQEPALGERFAVHTLPTVKLFYRARVVGEFVGALSGGTIEGFLTRHLPSEADAVMSVALEQVASGDTEGGVATLQRALLLDPRHDEVRLELARLAYLRADAAAIEHHASEMTPYSEHAQRAQSLRLLLEQVTGDELHAHHPSGCQLAREARWSEAIEALLHEVTREQGQRARAARSAVLAILGFLGEQDERAIAGHEQLREAARR